MALDVYKETMGQISNISRLNNDRDKNWTDDEPVLFFAAENQKYGFDAFNERKYLLGKDYPLLDNGYQPAFKSIVFANFWFTGLSSANNILTERFAFS